MSIFVPGAGLWVDEGHLSVTTAVCTYSQQSLVRSALVKMLKGLILNLRLKRPDRSKA